MYHKSCYVQRRRETGRAELTPETEDYSISPKKTRSVTQLSFDVSLCVFCQVKSSKAKGSLIAFCTDRAQASVDAAIFNSTDMVMKGRLAGVDLTASEVNTISHAIWHFCVPLLYMQVETHRKAMKHPVLTSRMLFN